MNPANSKSDRKDNSRVTRWLITAVILLFAAALVYNFVERERTGPLPKASSPPASATSGTPAAPPK